MSVCLRRNDAGGRRAWGGLKTCLDAWAAMRWASVCLEAWASGVSVCLEAFVCGRGICVWALCVLRRVRRGGLGVFVRNGELGALVDQELVACGESGRASCSPSEETTDWQETVPTGYS